MRKLLKKFKKRTKHFLNWLNKKENVYLEIYKNKKKEILKKLHDAKNVNGKRPRCSILC